MEEDNKNAGNDNNSSKQNCVIIGKLVLSFDQLNELIPLIVTNIVNGKHEKTMKYQMKHD